MSEHQTFDEVVENCLRIWFFNYDETADHSGHRVAMREIVKFAQSQSVIATVQARVKLPPIGEELYEFYSNMSAQTHEALVKDYARKAVQAALSSGDEIERLTADRDGWMRTVAKIAASVPLKHAIGATGSVGDLVAYIETSLSALAAKDAENERLRLALKEAREMVAHWGAYASEYFQDKHDLPGDLGELDAALAGGSDAS